MYGMLNSVAQCPTLAGYILHDQKNKDLLFYISYTVKKNLTYYF